MSTDDFTEIRENFTRGMRKYLVLGDDAEPGGERVMECASMFHEFFSTIASRPDYMQDWQSYHGYIIESYTSWIGRCDDSFGLIFDEHLFQKFKLKNLVPSILEQLCQPPAMPAGFSDEEGRVGRGEEEKEEGKEGGGRDEGQEEGGGAEEVRRKKWRKAKKRRKEERRRVKRKSVRGGVGVEVGVELEEDSEAVEEVGGRIAEVAEAIGEAWKAVGEIQLLEAKGGGDEEAESLGDVEVVKGDDEEGREGKVKLGEGEAEMSNRETETEAEVREEEEEIGGPKALEAKKGEEKEEGEKGGCKSTKKLGTSNASSPLPPRPKQQP
ncbi:hypothetical protein BYT27DRAFT_7218928 [Phlegmacium glaucopus]|nr:hypothetical protein BYT27DRAFT_7218928 [Phlegmacium glaucopus]